MEDGVCLFLEAIWRAGGDQENQEGQKHACLNTKEEAHFVEKSRLESEEEGLQLKVEDEARLVEEARMKADKDGKEHLKAEE